MIPLLEQKIAYILYEAVTISVWGTTPPFIPLQCGLVGTTRVAPILHAMKQFTKLQLVHYRVAYFMSSFDEFRKGQYAAQNNQARRKYFLWNIDYNDCEGKDSGNYTVTMVTSRDQACDINSAGADTSFYEITQRLPNRQRITSDLKRLALSTIAQGAYSQGEVLWLSLDGSLEGKYVYQKLVYLDLKYLSICSSILGYDYVTTQSATLVISDRLDLNVLIAPTGAFDEFRRGGTTVCRGKGWIVGSAS
ncbi:unnamed protein product [Oppiella nova]|uniref:Uncharacterized protein n=1 Tax=Oppiella nova TaxID=334625 RepID=A0A7R9M2B9_9ACAR|nr:unnamed protein product [Oppiella nova]CAG2169238.1 unnamed protein product [Oppiella nova]